ncbi:MAG: hypothetical protein MI864_16965 [Pseudomonadales bacterium]|nr:hypothetical protein [Pseudomonadales bacterium]
MSKTGTNGNVAPDNDLNKEIKMKNYLQKFVLATALTTCAGTALAEIPNTFTAGTPAKADEVNENFAYIEERLNSGLQTEFTADCDADRSNLTTVLENLPQTKSTVHVNGTCNLGTGVVLTNKDVHIIGADGTVIRGAGSISEAMFLIRERTTLEIENLEISNASGNVNLFAAFGNSIANLENIRFVGSIEKGLQTAIMVFGGSVVNMSNIDVTGVTYGLMVFGAAKAWLEGDANRISASGTSGRREVPSAAIFVSENSFVDAENTVFEGVMAVLDNSTFKLNNGILNGAAMIVRRSSVVELADNVTINTVISAEDYSTVYGSSVQ